MRFGGAFSEVDLSDYKEAWFALKVVNGKITQTQQTHYPWKDITTVGENAWAYFHLTQTADSVWTIEIIKDGATVLTLENQIPAADKASNVSQLMDNHSNETQKGRLNIYHGGSGTAVIYASEIIALAKPFDPAIPQEATEVMEHVYNSYYFGENCGAVTGGSQSAPDAVWSEEAAPTGFSKVIEYDWSKANSKDFGVGRFNTKDLSGYSSIYFAMNVVGEGDNVGVWIQGASDSYKGGDWLYVYLTQNADGTWTKTVRATGYTLENVQKAVPGHTLVTMTQYGSGGVVSATYPTKDLNGTAMVYFTEVLGIQKA